jgi:hypothetical protein
MPWQDLPRNEGDGGALLRCNEKDANALDQAEGDRTGACIIQAHRGPRRVLLRGHVPVVFTP